MTTTTIQSPQTQATSVGVPPTPSEAHQKADGFDFNKLLARALNEPGILSKAYSRFHRFSLGNQLLAVLQLEERGMPLSPIASYNHWQELGRMVRKGEKALSLFMPVTIKHKEMDDTTGEEIETGKVYMRFMMKRHWFTLDQTEGVEYQEPIAIPTWDAEQGLMKLGISEKPFAMVNGNVQGYAMEHSIAVSPLAEYPHKTRFHELAHVVLGHTNDAGCWDTASLSKQVKEAEAEGVAFILCSLLDLPGQAESRGYIQNWLDGENLPEKSAQRIFSAAQTILAAGKPE